MKKINNDVRTIRNYTEYDGNKVRIVKAPNGRYFNEYTSHGAGAGPFDTFKDAETILKKHRPTARKVSLKSTKRKVQSSKTATTKAKSAKNCRNSSKTQAKSAQKPQKRQNSKTVYQDKSVLVKKTASGIVIYSK